MSELYDLKEMLCSKLAEYGKKGELTSGSLDIIDKLAHATKNVGKIIEMSDEGFSEENRYSYNGGRYSREGSYRGGSYARGRGRGARRDSMGRYTRQDGYSRTENIEDLAESVREMMGELPEEVKRDAQKFLQKLDEM